MLSDKDNNQPSDSNIPSSGTNGMSSNCNTTTEQSGGSSPTHNNKPHNDNVTTEQKKNNQPSEAASGTSKSSSPTPPVTTTNDILTTTIITTVGVNDVLSGRGGRINAHPGNIQYRKLVERHKPIYLNPHTKKSEKQVIAANIVKEIRSMNPPGRFLKEIVSVLKTEEGESNKDDKSSNTTSTNNNSGRQWVDIGDDRAAQKTGQALRECGPEIRQQLYDKAEAEMVNLMSQVGSASRNTKCAISINGGSGDNTPRSPTPPNRNGGDGGGSGMIASFGGKRRALPLKKRKSGLLEQESTSPGSTTNLDERLSKIAKPSSSLELSVNIDSNLSKQLQEHQQQGGILSPQLNDVLSPSLDDVTSPPIFHHIGNRRFRVLVEANLSNYFSELTTFDQWIAWGSQETSTRTVKQCEVVKAVIQSVVGNNPSGRFLIQVGGSAPSQDNTANTSSLDNDDTKEHISKKLLGVTWKLATREEIDSKVHSTFLAAGRFHVKQHAALMISMEKELQERNAAQGALEQQHRQPQQPVVSKEAEVNHDTRQAASAGTSVSAKPVKTYPTTSNENKAKSTSSSSNSPVPGPTKDTQAMQDAARKKSSVLDVARESLRLTAIIEAKKGGGKKKKTGKGIPTLAHVVPPPSNLPQTSLTAAAAAAVAPMTSILTPSIAQQLGAQLDAALPSSIDDLYTKLILSRSGIQDKRPISIEDLYASAAAASAPRILTTNNIPTTAAAIISQRQEAEALTKTAVSAANQPSLLDSSITLTCPPKIKVFLSLPMKRFFVKNEEDVSPDSDAVPPAINASSSIMPSNYDVLCGPDRSSFFHHIGNRRFRVMIEMNIQRYEKAYLASFPDAKRSTHGGEDHIQKLIDEMGEDYIQKLIGEILLSLSKCHPPARFLGMDMTNGRWKVLNPVFANLKTETTFFECLQVNQKRQSRLLEEEWRYRIEMEKEKILHSMLSNQITLGQGLQRDGCSTGLCNSADVIHRGLPFVSTNKGTDLTSLQSKAQESLYRSNQPPPTSSSGPQGPSRKPTAAVNRMGMSDIVKRFSKEQSASSRELFKQIQKTALSTQGSELPSLKKRRSTEPIKPSFLPSKKPETIVHMPKRGSYISTDPYDSLKAAEDRPGETTSSLQMTKSSSRETGVSQQEAQQKESITNQEEEKEDDDSDHSPKMKGLLDVVDSMIMMRRGSL